MSTTTTSRLNTPSGSSSSRDPSSYSRSTPRSRTRSAAASLIQSFRRPGSQSNTPSRTPSSISGQARSFYGSQSNTPSRPTPSSISRQAHSFYGPGVHLEDVQRVDTVQDHSASDTSDFEFGISRPRSENIEQSHSASRDREVSPEIPICEPARVYGYAAGSQNEVIPMLQQQQLILQRVLESQKTLEERQNSIEEKLANLQSQVNVLPPTVSPTASTSDGKRKRLVTRALSNKVYSIHKEADKQFDPMQSYSFDDNKRVRDLIIKEIKNQPNCEFDEANIALAVKRCFENLRRTFKEQQSEKRNFVEEQAKRRKYRSRRERKFQRRSTVVSSGEREKYWKHLSLMYVTEESDDPDNPNGLLEHKLPWRSKKLTEFMNVLDLRLVKKQPQPSGLVAKKVRKIGTPSDSLPPYDAPSWALDKDTYNQENIDNNDQEEGHQLSLDM